MESVYEIGIELICNTGNANLYNFGKKSTQYDFNPIRSGLFQTANDPGGGGL